MTTATPHHQEVAAERPDRAGSPPPADAVSLASDKLAATMESWAAMIRDGLVSLTTDRMQELHRTATALAAATTPAGKATR